MLEGVYSTKFKKDYKLMQKRKLKMEKLINVMKDLEAEVPLKLHQREHPLVSNYKGFMECHVEPDWLLIYKIDVDAREIYFSRTGTHADLF